MSVIGKPVLVKGIGSASGAVATFPDGDGSPLRSLIVSIALVQEGSGDPSLTNIRPISGWTGLTLSVSGADTSNPETVSVSWVFDAGTVYGGTLNLSTGLLTVTRVCYALTGAEPFTLQSNSRRFQADLSDLDWANPANQPSGNASFNPGGRCSHCLRWDGSGDTKFSYRFQHYTSGLVRFNFYDVGDRFDSATSFLAYLAEQYTASTPVQVSYLLATPVTYQLTPQQISSLKGYNTIYADCGDVAVEYTKQSMLYLS